MHRRLLPGTVLLLALVMALASAAVAAPPRNFTTPLALVATGGTSWSPDRGAAHFQLSSQATELRFRLNVANIEDVTMAHIHIGARGVNGPVVVWLYPDEPPAQLIPGRSNGTLATGVITADDLVGQLQGHDLADLVALLESGEAYVNVHTAAHPAGEIRGQIDVPRGLAGG